MTAMLDGDEIYGYTCKSPPPLLRQRDTKYKITHTYADKVFMALFEYGMEAPGEFKRLNVVHEKLGVYEWAQQHLPGDHEIGGWR